MSNWNNLKIEFQKLLNNPVLRRFIGSPITKIVGINTAMFMLWRLKGVSETFLVKHFAYDRFNIKENRYHTMITYAFSHFGFFQYLFDMIIIATFGRSIRMQSSNKVVWMLYLLGAFAGGLSMHYGMPFGQMVVPKVGAEAATAAMITFSGMMNIHSTVIFFFFPTKIWVLLALMGFYAMIEPEKKTLGGMFAGLLVYQLFKFRII